VCKGNNCKFLWVHYPLRDSDTFEVRNNIQCFDVPLKNIIDVYTEICTIIPDESWPPMIKKISG
jgi:hypothetical protein